MENTQIPNPMPATRHFHTRVRMTMRCAAIAVLMFAAVAGMGCGRKRQQVKVPVSSRPVLPSVLGAYEEGIASWYGDPYHGRRTANGEIYDQEKMTAAHPTLRFGVVVSVTNLSNGLRTQVRINDRGPFVKDRAIDLSRAAAREIAMLGPGTAPVRVEVVGLPESPPQVSTQTEPAASGPVPSLDSAPPPVTAQVPNPTSAPGGESSGSLPGGFAIQMGAFARYENAAALREQLLQKSLDARLVAGENPSNAAEILWRVLVGSHLVREEAEKLFETLRVDFPRIILVSDH